MNLAVSFAWLALLAGTQPEPPARPSAVPLDAEAKWTMSIAREILDAASFGKIAQPESVGMLDAMLKGKMGKGEGWFHPSHAKHDWKWLARRFDADRDGRVTLKEYRGPREIFDRLDRDGDGALTANDFDWTDQSVFLKQKAQATALLRKFDDDGDDKLSRAEWDALFTKLANGKDHLTPDDLRRLLLAPPVTQPAAKKGAGGMPSRNMLLAGLVNGEIGSPFEGARVGALAPLFALPTHDGKRTVALADHLGEKPVVLIFGSFT